MREKEFPSFNVRNLYLEFWMKQSNFLRVHWLCLLHKKVWFFCQYFHGLASLSLFPSLSLSLSVSLSRTLFLSLITLFPPDKVFLSCNIIRQSNCYGLAAIIFLHQPLQVNKKDHGSLCSSVPPADRESFGIYWTVLRSNFLSFASERSNTFFAKKGERKRIEHLG